MCVPGPASEAGGVRRNPLAAKHQSGSGNRTPPLRDGAADGMFGGAVAPAFPIVRMRIWQPLRGQNRPIRARTLRLIERGRRFATTLEVADAGGCLRLLIHTKAR